MMKDLLKLVILYYAVGSSEMDEQFPKPHLERWIWDSTETVPNVLPETRTERLRQKNPTNPFIAENKYQSCEPYDPPVPDFRGQGLRISDAICQEYIWNEDVLIEKNRRKIACESERERAAVVNDTNKPFEYEFLFIGGRQSLPLEFPHMGAIGWKGFGGEWEFKCGSTLISSKFVLTAAHCTQASDTDTNIVDVIPKIVRFGYNDIKNSDSYKSDFNIVAIIIYPYYKAPSTDHDIALMGLQRPVTFTDSIKPACLWGHYDTSSLGNIGTVTGWGVVIRDSYDISPHLQTGNLDIIELDKCNNLLQHLHNRHWHGVTEYQICAGKLTGGVDACQGDSGGPMQVRVPMKSSSIYYVIGVTSFGFGCAYQNTPGIYTRVSSYIDWIESVVWP